MSKREKRLKALLNNAKTVRPDDLFLILEDDDWVCTKKGTSHRVYRKEGVGQISIPFKKPYIKETYVLQVIEALGLSED
jgi:predicted RNA binding protein YcfA (HicA-like mRNA interferase family)